jgi:hypothetical protein
VYALLIATLGTLLPVTPPRRAADPRLPGPYRHATRRRAAPALQSPPIAALSFLFLFSCLGRPPAAAAAPFVPPPALCPLSAGPIKDRTLPDLKPAESLEPPAAMCSAGPAGPAVPAAPAKRIGAIRVVTQNVFDPRKPGEGRGLFRLANRLHRTTRPLVVERQLLMRPGDPFSLETVRESERLLRANPYIYDAAIRPVEGGDGTIDLDVLTRDVWTLQGGLSWNRSGGANTTELSLEDGNFLGTGKDLTVARRANVDRSSNFFRYLDPNLAGSRALLDLRLANNSDGRSRRFILDRPFFALDTRWAAGATAYTNDRVDSLYDAGKIASRFRQRQDFLEAYAGLSPGFAGGASSRWRLGYTYDRNVFGPPLPAARAAASFGPLPAAAPAARQLTYPWLAYDFVADGFITVHDLNRIQRTEDVNLGRQLSLRLGYSDPLFGGGRRATLLKAAAAQGWQPGPRRMLLALAAGSGRWEKGRIADGLVSGSLRLFDRDWGNNVLYAALSGDLARRLDPEAQLLLGGDTGLRGYPLRYAAGDRRLLFTLEQRFYSDREIFHLLYAGAAVFFDAGRAWFAGQPAGPSQRTLKDIGFGLRLCSSRSSGGSVVHLDIAYPLDRSRGLKGMQWLISTGESF